MSGYVPITAPSANPVNCDASLPAEFGNTGLTQATITMAVQSVTDSTTSLAVAAETLSAVQSAFSFGSVTLLPGQSGQIPFTLTNTLIPPGAYDIHFKTNAGGTINDVNAFGFVLTASEPVAFDTLEPEVNIVSPAAGAKIYQNGVLNVAFTAKDPDEGGAGTGVTAVSATVTSAGGAVTQSIDNLVVASPGLPVPAGVTVNVAGSGIVTAVGSYTLTAEATDGAEHTGSAGAAFSVALNVGCLPPVSIVNRQFNIGSTVPVKWAFTDANGAFLPPFSSITVTVEAAGVPTATFVAGTGVSNVRWELDENGNATQYIVNYKIPVAGKQYVAHLKVADVDGNLAEQGTCTFLSSTKGGIVK